MATWFKSKLRLWQKQRQLKKLKDSRFAFLFEEPLKQGVDDKLDTYICFDCETTGLNPKKDKIITLSAIKIQGNQILASQALNLWIEQACSISPESIAVHQIRNTDLQEYSDESMEERRAIEQFLNFIQGYPLVGYYLEFDVAMVNQVIKPWLGITLPNRQIEVSELYYELRVKTLRHSMEQLTINLKFDAILTRLNIPNLGQHDAFSDALMTALIFLKLQEHAKR